MNLFNSSTYNLKQKWLLILLPLLILLGIGGWLVHEQTRVVTYVIPPGTNQQIKVGKSVAALPDMLVFTIGVNDTLVIKNQDTAFHTVGPFSILPGDTFTHRFKTPLLYNGDCSLYPGRQIRIIVKPAPWWYIFP